MKVSIITAVYNSQDYLEDYFNSLLNQTHKDIEIICVDDGSSDRSLVILNHYQKRYPEKVIVIQQKHEGVGNARNKALHIMTGDYYCYVDHDDWLSENAIAKALHQINQLGVDASLFSLLFYYPNNPERTHVQNRVEEGVFSAKKMFYYTLDWKISAFGVYKASFRDYSIINNPSKNYYEDEFQARKIILALDKVAINEGVYFYRQRENSLTSSFNMNSLGEFELQYKTKELMEKEGLYASFYLPFELQSIRIYTSFIRKIDYHKNKLSFNERAFMKKALVSFKEFINVKKVWKSIFQLESKEKMMLCYFMLPFIIQQGIAKVLNKVKESF